MICMKPRLALFATMSAVVFLNACGDPTSIKATSSNVVDTLSVFALSGTPPSYPSGVSILGLAAVQVDGFAGFDVALDIDASGNPVVYPVKLVVNSLGGGRPVGLIKVTQPFESVAEAPKTGFVNDQPVALAPGETVIIQSAHNTSGDICQFALSPYIYAKLAVDSVNLASRTLYLRLGLDPNCGFRSFASGIPTS
jgi:hypothetical protein